MVNLFHPFPLLQTDRLTLRALQSGDAHEIMLQRSNPQLQAFVEVEQAGSIEYARYFIRKIHESMSEGACVYWAIPDFSLRETIRHQSDTNQYRFTA